MSTSPLNRLLVASDLSCLLHEDTYVALNCTASYVGISLRLASVSRHAIMSSAHTTCTVQRACRLTLMAESAEAEGKGGGRGGHVVHLQLGSRTLRSGNDEDAEKGHAFYDVFAIADLEALALKARICWSAVG